jgi:hypothetical protein
LSLISSFGISKIENVLSKSGITDFATRNTILKKDKDRKLKMEKHFENKHCVKPSQFKVGDHVLVKQEKKDKLTPPTPLKIKETNKGNKK